jgi:hypothetical protein
VFRQLKADYPSWTSALQLVAISLQYNRAIHTLRHKRGLQIENRVVTRNGIRCGEFRLVPSTTQPAKIFPTPIHRDTENLSQTFPEFGSIEAQRYPD